MSRDSDSPEHLDQYSTDYPVRDLWLYGGQQSDPNKPFAASNDTIQKLYDSGAIKQTSRDYSNEGGSGTYTEQTIDWSKLPQGDVVKSPYDWVPASKENMRSSNVYDPSALYNDSIYGPVTPRKNVKEKEDDWTKYVGPAFATALLAFTGAPMLIGTGLGLARAIGGGGSGEDIFKNMAISAASSGIAGGLGASMDLGSFGQSLLNTGISAGLNTAVTGKAPNPFNLALSLMKPSTFSNISSLISSGGT